MPASTGPGSLLANGDVLKFFNSFYTPATGSWTPAGKYPTGVTGGSTATLLPTGFVLATGFMSTYNASPPLNASYLYNFNTNTYAITGRMTTNRAQNTATLLPNGQVLISGGHNHQSSALSSAELYTP